MNDQPNIIEKITFCVGIFMILFLLFSYTTAIPWVMYYGYDETKKLFHEYYDRAYYRRSLEDKFYWRRMINQLEFEKRIFKYKSTENKMI